MSSAPRTHQAERENSEQPLKSKLSGPPNILIFGETGVGKSSIINMLAGRDIAETSGDTMGQTFGNVRYSVDISNESSTDDTNTDSRKIIVWDTAGLNEAEHGKVSHDVAMGNIRNLVGKLEDGLSLLVYVVRGWRLSSVLKTNYDIFVTGLCQGRVPVVLVITGCENDSPMDSWWTRNEKVLDAHKLGFKGHACVTSTRGKIKDGEYVFEEEYKESKEKVRYLVVGNLLERAWVADEETLHQTDAWFSGERTFSRTESRMKRRTVAGPQDRTYSMTYGVKPKVQALYPKGQRTMEGSSRSKRSGWELGLNFFASWSPSTSSDFKESEATGIIKESYR